MKQILLLLISMLAMPVFCTEPIIIAHRGASGYEPENTLRSFKRAIQMGAPIIELDVYVCKTGELVITHDDIIDIKTDGKQTIGDVSYDVLKKFDVGKGEHIPLLSEVFDLVNKQAIINIELKGPGTVRPVAQLITHYINKKKWPADRFIISSFDHYRLLEFKKYVPSIKTAVLFEGNPIGYSDLVKHAKADYALMHYQWITKEFVSEAHRKNIKVFAYTINNKQKAEKLLLLGVDGIITDYPDLLFPSRKNLL